MQFLKSERLQANRTVRKYSFCIEDLDQRIMLDATGMIATTPEYLLALKNHQVREVSPDIFGVFPINDSLYPDQLNVAWAGSSDDMYTLLKLNQQFPGTSSADIGFDYKLSQQTIEGMERTVGFPFAAMTNGIDNTYVNPESPMTNSGIWEGLQIKVFNKLDNPEIGKAVSPSFDGFFKIVDEMRPAGEAPLPRSVVTILKQLYRKAADANISPLEVYSRSISGISSYRLADQGISGADIVTNPDTGENSNWVINPRLYRIYSKANEAIGPAYVSTQRMTPKTLVSNFFAKFVAPLVKVKPEGWRRELAIGFRCLLAMAFDASPNFSSFGIGYSNVANPMAGGPQYSNKPGTTPVETFNNSIYAGQEYLIINRSVASLANSLTLGGPPPEEVVSEPSWLQRDSSGQFYGLAPTTQIPVGLYNTTPQSGSYQWSGQITQSGTGVIFDAGSTTSDTIIAQIRGSGQRNSLKPSTRIGSGRTLLSDLPALANAHLNHEFATYISLGGGLDRVTGSALSDVIIGPSLAGVPPQQANGFSGVLIVNSGAGNDVAEPGRGGSLVWLGTGHDKLIVGQGDLFGQATLMDFQANQDRLIIDPSFTVKGWNTNTLAISNANGDQKTLVLTGTSSSVWKHCFVNLS